MRVHGIQWFAVSEAGDDYSVTVDVIHAADVSENGIGARPTGNRVITGPAKYCQAERRSGRVRPDGYRLPGSAQDRRPGRWSD